MWLTLPLSSNKPISRSNSCTQTVHWLNCCEERTEDEHRAEPDNDSFTSQEPFLSDASDSWTEELMILRMCDLAWSKPTQSVWNRTDSFGDWFWTDSVLMLWAHVQSTPMTPLHRAQKNRWTVFFNWFIESNCQKELTLLVIRKPIQPVLDSWTSHYLARLGVHLSLHSSSVSTRSLAWFAQWCASFIKPAIYSSGSGL